MSAPRRADARLLLIDLDNTLIDRAGAFERWAGGFVGRLGGAAPSDVDWLIEADGDGYVPRDVLATSIAGHFELGSSERDAVLETLRQGWVEHIELDAAVIESLTSARESGWTVVVVTNGTVAQQERKLCHTGLDRHVDGWIISEAAGVKKPDSQIFTLAAAAAALPLSGWMVGDNPTADIAGAHQVGLSTVWLHRGRDWQLDTCRPTTIADTCSQAIQALVA